MKEYLKPGGKHLNVHADKSLKKNLLQATVIMTKIHNLEFICFSIKFIFFRTRSKRLLAVSLKASH